MAATMTETRIAHQVQHQTIRKVAITDANGNTTIKEELMPQPADFQVLIKVEASGVCATDLHLVRRSIPYLQPTVNIHGHEGIGRIVELGSLVDSKKWKIGERVSHRWIYRVCQQCEMCQNGVEQLCEKRALSGKDVDGCWAGKRVFKSVWLLIFFH